MVEVPLRIYPSTYEKLSNRKASLGINITTLPVNSPEFELFYNILAGNGVAVQDAIKTNKDLLKKTEQTGKNPLQVAVACESPNLDIIRFLLDRKKTDVDHYDKSGNTALKLAIDTENQEVIEILANHKKVKLNKPYKLIKEKKRLALDDILFKIEDSQSKKTQIIALRENLDTFKNTIETLLNAGAKTTLAQKFAVYQAKTGKPDLIRNLINFSQQYPSKKQFDAIIANAKDNETKRKLIENIAYDSLIQLTSKNDDLNQKSRKQRYNKAFDKLGLSLSHAGTGGSDLGDIITYFIKHIVKQPNSNLKTKSLLNLIKAVELKNKTKKLFSKFEKQ